MINGPSWRDATDQQLSVILRDDPTATLLDQIEAQAEMLRRINHPHQREQFKIVGVYPK